ncbi:hypothetical protein FMUND_11437 [Fusarium mundagurra]|uniref:Uncharacterized protein n=1 Tax=Fusarium mundagurra TaxID=1567541 RepID=A0A8H5Y865_9HYPO|nr:hypothetical protein FMUND_11437 [Fusarium mundagurra]
MASQLVIDPVATRAYTHAHGDTAFTSTNMIDRTNDPTTYANIVRHYGVSRLSTTGTCTGLAIRTATALDSQNPGVYNFQMYDVGNHKICRCLNTYTIIDSSSRDGAVAKAPGEEWRYKHRRFVWQFDGSVVVTNGAQPVILLILFRFTTRSGCRFFGGFMKWHLEGDDKGTGNDVFSRYLVMAASLKAMKENDKENIWRIVWKEGIAGHQDKTGTVATNKQCQNQMARFVEEFGSSEQWEHDDCDSVHDCLTFVTSDHEAVRLASFIQAIMVYCGKPSGGCSTCRRRKIRILCRAQRELSEREVINEQRALAKEDAAFGSGLTFVTSLPPTSSPIW